MTGALLASMLGPTACGGAGGQPKVTTPVYRPALPLHLHVSGSARDGPLRLEHLIYTSADGERVPALFAAPAGRKSHGCLVYQGDFEQTKEEGQAVREGAAALGLATFTIDPRNVGARGSTAQALAAIARPESLLEMVLGTEVDLRVGLDHLESRPECRRKIGYVGTGFGALVGAVLAGQDRRVSPVVLTSIGPTFEQTLLVSNLAAVQNPDIPALVPGAATDPGLLARAVRLLRRYDPARWARKIAPRPLMLISGRRDPLVLPIDVLELAAAARHPKTVLYVDSGHDPLAPGPAQARVGSILAKFLVGTMGLPRPSAPR